MIRTTSPWTRQREIGVGVTSKLPDIPEPVTLKMRDIEKLKVVDLKDAL